MHKRHHFCANDTKIKYKEQTELKTPLVSLYQNSNSPKQTLSSNHFYKKDSYSLLNISLFATYTIIILRDIHQLFEIRLEDFL